MLEVRYLFTGKTDYNMLLSKLLSERTMTADTDRRGCLMAMIREPHAEKIRQWGSKTISESSLFIEGDDFGREKESHITIRYGFTRDLTPNEIKEVIREVKPFPIELEGTDIFRNERYDVIFLKSESPILRNMNEITKKFPNTTSHPIYNPHLTLAYVQPGVGERFRNKVGSKKMAVMCECVMYSGINHIKTPYQLAEMDAPPPAITQPAEDFSFSADFINFIKQIENAQKTGFKNGKWYPHASPEGGRPTIAYGHKIKTDKEQQAFDRGIDDRAAIKLLVKDLMEAKDKVRRYIDKKYRIHLILDDKQMEMLTEFAFNLGGLEKFPNFTDAVLRKDWKKAAQEYKRGYRADSGERRELTRRNQLFFDRYLK